MGHWAIREAESSLEVAEQDHREDRGQARELWSGYSKVLGLLPEHSKGRNMVSFNFSFFFVYF